MEIGVAIHSFDRIGRRWVADSWTINKHRGDLPTGGKAHDADAIGVEVPFGGAGADEAHGAL